MEISTNSSYIYAIRGCLGHDLGYVSIFVYWELHSGQKILFWHDKFRDKFRPIIINVLDMLFAC